MDTIGVPATTPANATTPPREAAIFWPGAARRSTPRCPGFQSSSGMSLPRSTRRSTSPRATPGRGTWCVRTGERAGFCAGRSPGAARAGAEKGVATHTGAITLDTITRTATTVIQADFPTTDWGRRHSSHMFMPPMVPGVASNKKEHNPSNCGRATIIHTPRRGEVGCNPQTVVSSSVQYA